MKRNYLNRFSAFSVFCICLMTAGNLSAQDRRSERSDRYELTRQLEREVEYESLLQDLLDGLPISQAGIALLESEFEMQSADPDLEMVIPFARLSTTPNSGGLDDFSFGGEGDDFGGTQVDLPPPGFQQPGAEYPFAPLSSLSEVAELFPAPATTTKLFLNFDGFTDKNVSPFISTTGNRDRDIEEIMFRVAQVFAPFNVEVVRYYENSQFAESGGHTTIFIGDDMDNNVFLGEDEDGLNLNNKTRAFASADYPCLVTGLDHAPNSHDYNRGYVDPVSYNIVAGEMINYQSNDNARIARSICHEAGHTFGLAHVLPWANNPDIMSYNSSNMRAIYAEYDLTSLNNTSDGVVEDPTLAPSWGYLTPNGNGGYQTSIMPLSTQNSYRVLCATLGLRSTAGDISNIANDDLTHVIYADAMSASIDSGQFIPSEIEGRGDYDVFDFTAESSGVFKAEAIVWDDDNWFDPILMIFDSNGNVLINYDRSSGSGKDAEANFYGEEGESYKIVVGSYNNNTWGSFQLKLNPTEATINPSLPNNPGFSNGIDEPLMEQMMIPGQMQLLIKK